MRYKPSIIERAWLDIIDRQFRASLVALAVFAASALVGGFIGIGLGGAARHLP